MMNGGSEYPKWLRHPSFAPAVLSDDYMFGGGKRAVTAENGRPVQFPPVIVNNPDQEEYYVSRGYSAGAYDHQEVLRHQAAPLPNGYHEQEYPKYGENGEIVEDPNPRPVIDPATYPMWVGDKIAANAEEERALLVEMGLPLPEEDAVPRPKLTDPEWDEFLKWKASRVRAENEVEPKLNSNSTDAVARSGTRTRQPRRATKYKPPTTAEKAERAELMRLVQQAGMRPGSTYSRSKLRAMLDAATAPPRPDDAAAPSP